MRRQRARNARRVLKALASGPQTASQIAHSAELPLGTVTAVLDRLERQGKIILQA